MRIVIDTNIIISGIFFGGKPRELLKLCFSGDLQMVCTEEIFTEYIETINRFTKKSGKNIGEEIKPLLIENLEFIENRFFDSYSRDPDDDKFINCAMTADIKYIISGDKDLLVLEKINKIKIVEVANFIQLLIDKKE
ncbi:MAG: putative toxin-antitoxin system toxin component, PIN family [Spirochaetaceae bacterium]|nr:putative toxin-antitoxin system toxin component, PIN family [Spirochaetaceae bacterium]